MTLPVPSWSTLILLTRRMLKTPAGCATKGLLVGNALGPERSYLQMASTKCCSPRPVLPGTFSDWTARNWCSMHCFQAMELPAAGNAQDWRCLATTDRCRQSLSGFVNAIAPFCRRDAKAPDKVQAGYCDSHSSVRDAASTSGLASSGGDGHLDGGGTSKS